MLPELYKIEQLRNFILNRKKFSKRMRENIDKFSRKGSAASLRVRQEKARLRALELAPLISELQASGTTTLQAIANALNMRGVPTARGGLWSAAQVRQILTKVSEKHRDEVPSPKRVD